MSPSLWRRRIPVCILAHYKEGHGEGAAGADLWPCPFFSHDKEVPYGDSSKYGKKDIIKVEGLIPLNLDLLGFLDHNITVAVVKDGKLVEKKHLSLPQEVVGVATCPNPRCITSEERGLKQIFVLRDREKRVYRCKYCEEKLEDFK